MRDGKGWAGCERVLEITEGWCPVIDRDNTRGITPSPSTAPVNKHHQLSSMRVINTIHKQHQYHQPSLRTGSGRIRSSCRGGP